MSERPPEHVESEEYFCQIPEFVLYGDISAQAVRLYGVLNRYAGKERQATPSRKKLAERLRASVDTVDRAMKDLIRIKAVEVKPTFDEAGDQTSNTYLLRILRPGSRESAATGGGKDAATGSRESAAQMRASLNESQLEREKTFMSPDGDEPFLEFWNQYPQRNGKKNGKTKAHKVWVRLSADLQSQAMVAVHHYRVACDSGVTLAKDAERFLRDPEFIGDWQTPATESPSRNGSRALPASSSVGGSNADWSEAERGAR